MSREAHTKYVDELLKIQDAEGKRISAALLRALGRLLDISGGNLRKYVALVSQTRKVVIRDLIIEIRRAQKKAQKLGREFGKSKYENLAKESSEN